MGGDNMRFGLALSGGGIRGVAHIGVLKALEEEGLVPSWIAGTSAGSIVAGLYAYGYSTQELVRIAVDLQPKYIDPNFTGLALGFGQWIMGNKEKTREANDRTVVDIEERKKRASESIRMDAHAEYLSSIAPLTPGEKKNAPNIIFILMDDLGWGDLSCFGSRAIHTPNLDRMAEEGVIMDNCYSSSPVCSPSRFGFLTGRYPSRGFIRSVFFPTVEIEERHMVADRGYETPEELAGGRPSPETVERTRQAAYYNKYPT
jgi:hypothetical protein